MGWLRRQLPPSSRESNLNDAKDSKPPHVEGPRARDRCPATAGPSGRAWFLLRHEPLPAFVGDTALLVTRWRSITEHVADVWVT